MLIDFWAPRCSSCCAMAPVLEQFAGDGESLTVAKINVDKGSRKAA